jgi:hypothetical protein
LIDNFSLGLTHALMLLAAWRLLSRPDFDDDDAPKVKARGWFGKGASDDA